RLAHARPEDGELVGARCSRDARLRVVVEREAGLTLELGARDAGLERLDDEAPLRALESERAEGCDDLPRPARTDHVGRARARARHRVHPLDEAARRVLGPEDDDAAG